MTSFLLDDISSFDIVSIFGNIVKEWYYYLVALIVISGIILFCIFVKPKKRNDLSDTAKIVFTAILTAISTAVNVLTFYPVSYIAISFTMTICFISGLMLGTKSGFAVGFLGDLLGALLFPAGAYNPLIGLSCGLMGLFAGILFDYTSLNKILCVVIYSLLSLIVCTSGINTFALWLMYGMGKKTFWVYLIARLPWQCLVAVGNSALCVLFTFTLPKILPKSKFMLFPEKEKKTTEK